jgi:hypothetical protein
VPAEVGIEIDDINWDFDFPTFGRALLDFYPTSGSFHLTGGGFWVSDGGDFGVTGTIDGETEFGGTPYTPAQVGELRGAFNVKGFQPYLGIGFGNPVSRKIGLNIDLGVGFGDVPTVSVTATGTMANDPGFLSDLDAEIADIEDDIPEFLKYYPVLSISLSIGFGN